MLYIFAGLPGAGKSTLARLLAAHVRAVHLRIDTIEHALSSAGAPVTSGEGYSVAHGVAGDNLRLGLSVVADSVNPWPLTRVAWRDVAVRAGVSFAEIEVTCSDPVEHRRRVETRRTDIENFKLPTWEQVAHRDYRPWDTEHIVVDTAGQTVEESFATLLRGLALGPSRT